MSVESIAMYEMFGRKRSNMVRKTNEYWQIVFKQQQAQTTANGNSIDLANIHVGVVQRRKESQTLNKDKARTRSES